MYSPQVIEHFEHPRNAGELPNADVKVRVENPGCGDTMELSLRVRAEDGRITDAGFRTRGCVTSIACGSLLTELLKGKTIAEAQQIQRREIVDALGGLSQETMHGSHLAMDALRAALENLKNSHS